MPTNGGEIKTRKSNTPEHFTHSSEAPNDNNLPLRLRLCVLKEGNHAQNVFSGVELPFTLRPFPFHQQLLAD